MGDRRYAFAARRDLSSARAGTAVEESIFPPVGYLAGAALADKARQAIYLRRMDDALSMTEVAHARADRLTAR